MASGNGGHFKDNCNFDGYANSIFTVTIGAVDELGQMPYYAEQCAAMLAVTYSSGQGHQRNIVRFEQFKHTAFVFIYLFIYFYFPFIQLALIYTNDYSA